MTLRDAPRASDPTGGDAPTRIVAALVCHDHVAMALDGLGSLQRLCRDPVRFVVHDDGTLTPQDVRALQEGLAGSRVVPRAEADERMATRLAAHPAARDLRVGFPLALKLFDAPLLCEADTFAFCDSDVLFLKPVRDPYDLSATDARALFVEDRESCYSLRSWQKLLATGVRLPARANTGLVAFDLEAYDLDYLEWFVGRARHRGIPPMLEQTAWAALGARVGCAKYDPRQVRVMRAGEDVAELVAGHFTARTRHLWGGFVDRSSSAGPHAAPVRLRTVPPGSCSAAGLARFELRRLARRLGRGG